MDTTKCKMGQSKKQNTKTKPTTKTRRQQEIKKTPESVPQRG